MSHHDQSQIVNDPQDGAFGCSRMEEPSMLMKVLCGCLCFPISGPCFCADFSTPFWIVLALFVGSYVLASAGGLGGLCAIAAWIYILAMWKPPIYGAKSMVVVAAPVAACVEP